MEGVEWREWGGGSGMEGVGWREWSGGSGVEGLGPHTGQQALHIYTFWYAYATMFGSS